MTPSLGSLTEFLEILIGASAQKCGSKCYKINNGTKGSFLTCTFDVC